MTFSYVHSFEQYETQLNFFAYLTYFLVRQFLIIFSSKDNIDIMKHNCGPILA